MRMQRLGVTVAALILGCIAASQLASAESGSLGPQAAFSTLPWGFSASNISLTVTSGAVPSWLRGSLYRNGPGLYPNVSDPHWFDGLALLQAFHFNEGVVTYDANFVGSSTYNQSKPAAAAASASASFFSSATDSADSAARSRSPPYASAAASAAAAATAAFQPSVNTGVTIQELNGRLLSSTATTSSNAFLPVSVGNAACPFVFDDEDAVPFLMACEHRRRGPDGSLYHFAYDPWSVPGSYLLYRMHDEGPASGAPCVREVFASVPYTYGQNYQHSFSVTANYLILTEPPVAWPTPFSWDAFTMAPNGSSYFRVVDLKSGEEVATFEAEGFFYMHAINAYETESTEEEESTSGGSSGSSSSIVIDLITYPDASLLGLLSLHNIFHNFSAIPWAAAKTVRFVLPLPAAASAAADADMAAPPNNDDAASTAASDLDDSPAAPQATAAPIFVSSTPLGGPPIELPTTNPAYEGLRYRFLYAMAVGSASSGADGFYNAIVKMDVHSSPAAVYSWQAPGCIPAESVFVASPAASKEDDGLLLSIVIDSVAEASFLLMLDASDLSEVARVALPQMMPLGFHGIFSSLGVETRFTPEPPVALE